MMKKYKGFTLVELLAIITILGVMVILVVPQIGGSINAKKGKELEKIIDIIEKAGKAYHTFNNDEHKIPIDTLVSEKYLSNVLTNPITNEKLDGCVRVSKGNDGIFKYRYTACESIDVSVTIDLRGGSSTQFLQEITQNTYSDSSKIELVNPTKENFDFSHWEVVKGNSYINDNDNTLIIGDTETIVYAIWESWPTLTLDLNEGTIENNFGGIYKSGTTIETTKPTKDGYKFIKWEVTSGNGLISGNNFTMGSSDTTLKAIWGPASLINSYSCANVNGGEEPYSFTYTGNCEIIDDGDDNWRVKFLKSGTFTPNVSTNIDVFLVGGGGAGGTSNGHAGSGGGGGYTLTEKNIKIDANVSYGLTIGAGGQKTSAFNFEANPGNNGVMWYGGNGGSGGGGGGYFDKSGAAGGSDGSNGHATNKAGGAGQGTTTREFGESTGDLYAGGGGGGTGYNESSERCYSAGGGGAGGGGAGGSPCKSSYSPGKPGKANTGGGGGGGGYAYNGGGAGGSGIVVIRNARG